MEGPEQVLAAEFGGPGPEDFANGAAALASGLAREAKVLAQAAAGLRGADGPDLRATFGTEGRFDVRRGRFVVAAASEAAMRAALALDAASLLADGKPAADQAERIIATSRRIGVPPATLAPLLRAAALDFRTDDAAARIAASTLAAELCALLARDPA